MLDLQLSFLWCQYHQPAVVVKSKLTRHALEYDEDFTTRRPAKQDSKNGRSDENQKKRKHQDRDHQSQRRVSNQCRSRQRQLEVTQCDDDFARQDQNMNGQNWMTNPSRWTNINESKSWTTTNLEWEANERN